MGARRLRGMSSIDLEDEESKDIIQNATRKLEVHMDAAMPCKEKPSSFSSCQETRPRLEASNEVQKQNMLV